MPPGKRTTPHATRGGQGTCQPVRRSLMLKGGTYHPVRGQHLVLREGGGVKGHATQ